MEAVHTGESVNWIDAIKHAVYAAVKAARLRGASAKVDESGPNEQGISDITVRPEATEAARFSVAWDEHGDVAFLSVGEATALELPADGGRYTDLDSADELRVFVEAIVEGRLSEKIWMDTRGNVVAARAEFRLPERVIKVRTTSFPWMLFRRRSLVRHYQPY